MRARSLLASVASTMILTATAACGTSTTEPAAAAPPATPAAVAELGAPESRALVVVGTRGDGLDTPRDLAFDPEVPDRLWVVNAGIAGVVIYDHAGTAEQTSQRRADIFAPHFMSNPSSIAFGDDHTFATCSESRDEWNGASQPIDDFMGPTLWSSYLDVFAAVNQEHGTGREGSHLDMLHESPWCMGLEHDVKNVYYAFDGLDGHVVRYDFRMDHGAGGTDHSDGAVRRYPDAKVTRVPGVPGHLALDHDSGLVYVADTGAGRIMKLDPSTGTSKKLQPDTEPLAEYTSIAGATYSELASGLKEPSGIELHDGKLFVAEHGTGDIIAFDLEGKELDRVHTGAHGLMGLAFSAEGKLHFVDAETGHVVRVDPVKSADAIDHPEGAVPAPLGPTCSDLVNDGPDVTELRIPKDRPDATTGGAIPDGRYHVTKIETYTGVGGDVGTGTFKRRETYVVSRGSVVGVQRDVGDAAKDYHVTYDTQRAGTKLGVHATCNEGPAAARGATYDVTATGVVFYYDFTNVVVTWTRVPGT